MNKTKFLLTVIIPIHDVSQFLFDSKSWRFGFEPLKKEVQLLLIWDRLLHDDSLALSIKEAFKMIQDVELIEGNFKGPGTSRNAGLEQAKGEWVVFWDSDDRPLLDPLLTLLRSKLSEGTDYIVTEYSTFARNLDNCFSTKDRGRYTMNPGRWYESGLGIWRIIFKKKSIENLQFPNLRMGEDLVFFICFSFAKPKPKFSTAITYVYQVNSPTQLTSNSAIKREETSKAFLIADVELDRHNQKDVKGVIASLYVRLFLAAVRYSPVRTKIVVFLTFIRRTARTFSKCNLSLITALLNRLRVGYPPTNRNSK